MEIEACARFNCTKERGGIDMSFTEVNSMFQTYYYDWHRFIEEPAPFQARRTLYTVKEEMWKTAANVSDNEASTVFKNPWKSLVQINIHRNSLLEVQDPAIYHNKVDLCSLMFLDCNTTGQFPYMLYFTII